MYQARAVPAASHSGWTEPQVRLQVACREALLPPQGMTLDKSQHL